VASSGKHIPALDGIRGMAVLLVMVFHFCLHSQARGAASAWVDLQAFRALGVGWVGVDLFFVMSGFLITGILYDSRRDERYFQNFYARRFLRIFPLYYAFLALRFWVTPVLFPSLGVESGTQLLYWTYLSNTQRILTHTGAALSEARVPGVFHFWSLAVEEQFYLFWPFLVWRLERRTLMRLCLGLVVAGPVVRMGLRFAFEPEVAHVAMIARLDALALGAYLVLLARGEGLERARQWAVPALVASGATLAAIFLARGGLFSSDLWMQAAGYSATAVLAGSLLVRALHRPGWTGSRQLQFLGRYCYGLYVFNGPLAHLLGLIPAAWFRPVFGYLLPAQLLLVAVGLALNIGFALLSWHLLEKRCLALRPARKPAPAAEPAVVT
jgi:peptidoglycan/LPS O-acetylase OafA/YrhL